MKDEQRIIVLKFRVVLPCNLPSEGGEIMPKTIQKLFLLAVGRDSSSVLLGPLTPHEFPAPPQSLHPS
jgi:hypothetical protein